MEERTSLINLYFHLGLNYSEILNILAFRHDIVLSERHLKRILKSCKLRRRKRYSQIWEVVSFIQRQLNISGQMHGYRWMHQKCLQAGYVVPKENVRLLLQVLDSEGVARRRKKRLQRRRYFSKGPNYLWHVDSYDKLKPFGICINGCIDGFSRYIVWLNAYITSSDPKVVGGYYMEAVELMEGCPKIMRSDFGTENGHIAQLQMFLRRNGKDALSGSKSFIYGRSTSNQRIESWWSILRRECCQFWLNIFHKLKDDGHFSGSDLDKNLSQFCFLPIIQKELDGVVKIWNTHNIRPSINGNVPHGRPLTMYNLPEAYNTQDFICAVAEEEINICKEECTFRNWFMCDPDVYEMCLIYMEESSLTIPKDAYEALNLFLHLKEKLNYDM